MNSVNFLENILKKNKRNDDKRRKPHKPQNLVNPNSAIIVQLESLYSDFRRKLADSQGDSDNEFTESTFNLIRFLTDLKVNISTNDNMSPISEYPIVQDILTVDQYGVILRNLKYPNKRNPTFERDLEIRLYDYRKHYNVVFLDIKPGDIRKLKNRLSEFFSGESHLPNQSTEPIFSLNLTNITDENEPCIKLNDLELKVNKREEQEILIGSVILKNFQCFYSLKNKINTKVL